MIVDLAKTDAFPLGKLDVQPALRTVSSDEQSVTLEPRVMQVLVLLAKHAGQPVDRDTMIAQCWDGVIVGDDAIQRCIGRLRRLASELGGYEIETIPKVGYRLIEDGAVRAKLSRPRPDRLAAPPRLAFQTATFRGTGAKGDEFAELLNTDVAAALSLNRDVVILTGAGEVEPEFHASIEVRRSSDGAHAHCSIAEQSSGRLVWSSTIALPDSSIIDTGLPSNALVLDIAGRISAIVIAEVTRVSVAEPQAQSAWQAVVRANAAYQRIDLDNLALAIEEARAAIAMEPDFAAARAALANALAATFELRGGADRDIANEARGECDMALALAPEDPTVLAWTAHALLMITRPAEGLALAQKAVEIAPSHWIANLYLARHYLHHGHPVAAEKSLDDHARVAPLFPWKYFPMLQRGIARFMQGDLEGAQHLIRDAAMLNPRYPYSWISLMVLGAMKQDIALMRDSATRLKNLDGSDTLELQRARITHSYPDPAQAAMVKAAFETAWKA